jgi:hypothetical protein
MSIKLPARHRKTGWWMEVGIDRAAFGGKMELRVFLKVKVQHDEFDG